MTLVKVNNGFSKSFDGMMKDLFNEFPSAVSKTVREDVLHFPPVNIIDTDGAYVIELSSPGFEKADFIVKLESNIENAIMYVSDITGKILKIVPIPVTENTLSINLDGFEEGVYFISLKNSTSETIALSKICKIN